jgi:hypothetical protein
MNELNFKRAIIASTTIFILVFVFYTLPYALEVNDFIEVSLAGFANPITSGWSVDVITCWFIMSFWIFYEAKQYGVKRGWICLPLGIFPGVAFGLCLYLLLRHKQVKITATSHH